MKKILHIVSYYHNGFGYQENYLPVFQMKLGFRVKVITSNRNFPFSNYNQTMRHVLGEPILATGVSIDQGVEIIRKRSFSIPRLSPGIIYFYISDVLNEYQPDIVHVHGATNLVLFQVLKYQKIYGCKIFIDSHQDFSVEFSNQNIMYKIYYSIWRMFYRKIEKKHLVSRFLPITEEAQEWLTERLHIPSVRQTISPLGVDVKMMSYSSTLEKEFRVSNKLGNKLIIVNAGKQYEGKKILWIIDVAIQLQSKGLEIVLVLVGNASINYNRKVINKLKQLKDNSYIRFDFLPRDELNKVYCAADVGIWPGIPSNTIQEAMSCGVALGLPENNIVGHLISNNGFYLTEDVDFCSDEIIRIVNAHGMLDSMKENSMKLADKYSWKVITRDLASIYEK